MEEESEKNSSFSFNLDEFDCSNASTDSDRTELQIDISEVEDFNTGGKRRKKIDENETSFLNEMEEEIERQLDAKAAKTNLTATNVKNILKHVISNEHVMAMVHKRLNKEDGVVFEPYLTRAKVKQLTKEQPDLPWVMTPAKNTKSDVQVFIEDELTHSDESSDEEYNPDQDQVHSDDEKDVENSVGSDIDSQPPTPVTPVDVSNLSEVVETPEIQYDKEGIFKIPNTPCDPTEDESVGHRTRSKLCLSETPLEILEQELKCPDATEDLYYTDWDPEDEYIDFLKTLYYLPIVTNNEDDGDDPVADPEYNAFEDENLEMTDAEELREDKAVKIPKKELNSLIEELSDLLDSSEMQNEENQTQEQKGSHKKKMPDVPFNNMEFDVPMSPLTYSPSNIFTNISPTHTLLNSSLHLAEKSVESSINFSKVDNNNTSTYLLESNETSSNPMVSLIPVLAAPVLPELVNPMQRKLISIQMSQHVQLLAQQFVLNYKHLKWHQKSLISRENLQSLKTLAGNKNSLLLADNLDDALKLVSDWEKKLEDENFASEYTHFLQQESKIEYDYFTTRRKYRPRFHPELIRLMANSKALMHPKLLPEIFPITIIPRCARVYSTSEECLIALGLEQFIPYVKSLSKKFSDKRHIFADAVILIQKYLFPIVNCISLLSFIKRRKCSTVPDNPIKDYFIHGKTPEVVHKVFEEYKLLSPLETPTELLEPPWCDFIEKLKEGELEKFIFNKSSRKSSKSPSKKKNKKRMQKNKHSYLTSVDNFEINPNHELRNPVVNVFNMPTLNTPFKVANNTSTPLNDEINNTPVTAENVDSGVTNDTENEPVNDESVAESMRTDEEPAPQLRIPTPRLAKIRSVQNMKRLAQSVSSRNSSSRNNIESESKDDEDSSSFSNKGDNEDEIAELMLASTTIKKSTANRKKNKQARELENFKKFVEAENNINEDERSTKLATSFIQKCHLVLEPKDPELFKAIMNLFQEFETKAEKIKPQSPTNNASSSDDTAAQTELTCDDLSINLYKNICEKLVDYPELCSDFLLFLSPQQAAQIDKSVEYIMMQKMRNFISIAQMYFVKQPSRISKLMQAINQLAVDPNINLEMAQSIMGTALKGHDLIMDLFLQCLPTGKPPESLFADDMFEQLVCPVGPPDKNKPYDPDAPELYETLELPASTVQEDPYGGDGCKCECHNLDDETKTKTMNDHCAICGIRFLNGRMYMQTSGGLRPAKITFPGADAERLENISRVSINAIDCSILPVVPPARKRRKTTKQTDPIPDDQLTVAGKASSKNSPQKNEEAGPSVSGNKQTRRAATSVKSMPKISLDNTPVKDPETESPKSRRERRRSKRQAAKEDKAEIESVENQLEPTVKTIVVTDDTNISTGAKLNESSQDSVEDDETLLKSPEIELDKSNDKVDGTSDSDSSVDDSDLTNNPWTMEDDKILLESIQKDYSQKTFEAVSSTLNKTVEQVKKRCDYLLSLLEKMAS
ncbi:hypothetical protein TKK_0006010 [Trichogramma kaykai]|uniref:Myb-like domain-containing protein n=1 Tax=Trichogramma kaykai TaxID=54128 RepID=A0ABD2XE76_9HYME